MGKCDVCKKEILYNQYKRYRKQLLCKECYDTRLIRKRQKKAKAEKAILDAKETNAKAAEYGMPSSYIDPSEKTEEPKDEPQ